MMPGQTAAATANGRMPADVRRARAVAGWMLLIVLCLIVASFVSLDLQWARFTDERAMTSMLKFFAELLSPATEVRFLLNTAWAALETLAMSAVGTLLAALGGLFLALPATQMSGPGAPLVRSLARFALNVLRSIPELVWAALLVIAAGLGPFAGTLALALHTAGVLGRLFAEAIENAPAAPAQALRVQGIPSGRVFLYATLPQISPQLLSYSLYRWENNIRAAAIMGVVGGGGLGALLSFHMGLFHMRETSTLLATMLLLVALVDLASWLLRRKLQR